MKISIVHLYILIDLLSSASRRLDHQLLSIFHSSRVNDLPPLFLSCILTFCFSSTVFCSAWWSNSQLWCAGVRCWSQNTWSHRHKFVICLAIETLARQLKHRSRRSILISFGASSFPSPVDDCSVGIWSDPFNDSILIESSLGVNTASAAAMGCTIASVSVIVASDVDVIDADCNGVAVVVAVVAAAADKCFLLCSNCLKHELHMSAVATLPKNPHELTHKRGCLSFASISVNFVEWIEWFEWF